MIKEWKKEDLEAKFTKQSTGIVYFYTPLCGTCQLASKMLQVVAEMIQVEIGKINLNFYPDIAIKMAIESVPCLVLLKNGRVADKIYAFHSVPFLLEKINQLESGIDIFSNN
jgi:thioredoxin-like negative regulator of GroEL